MKALLFSLLFASVTYGQGLTLEATSDYPYMDYEVSELYQLLQKNPHGVVLKDYVVKFCAYGARKYRADRFSEDPYYDPYGKFDALALYDYRSCADGFVKKQSVLRGRGMIQSYLKFEGCYLRCGHQPVTTLMRQSAHWYKNHPWTNGTVANDRFFLGRHLVMCVCRK